nr:MAG TPA: hypothetical protein [Caudoviricetes sp.]
MISKVSHPMISVSSDITFTSLWLTMQPAFLFD